MNLIAESPVIAADGALVGHVVGINFNPATNQIVDLRVRGEAPQLMVAIPVLSVADLAEEEVLLSISAASCRRLAANPPRARHHAAPAGQAASREVLRQELPFGATVVCLDGPVGPLRRILYDQYSYDIEELVLGTSQWLDHEVGVPFDWVQQIRGDQIVLGSRRQEVTSMPPAPEDR